MGTCDIFMNDGLGCVGMEKRYYPMVFARPSGSAYHPREWTDHNSAHANCILAIEALSTSVITWNYDMLINCCPKYPRTNIQNIDISSNFMFLMRDIFADNDFVPLS